MKYTYLVGKKFGKLTVLAVHGGNQLAVTSCRCSCGQQAWPNVVSLLRGHTRSCGCLVGEKLARAKTTHGQRYAPEYQPWAGMLARCRPGKRPDAKHYYERGIRVCKRWHRFENFYKDMAPRPSAKHSIERINVNRGYYPRNCRWATQKEQTRNARFNVNYRYNGKRQCIAAWAEEYGIPYRNLYMRLRRNGGDIKKALGVDKQYL